MRYNRDEMRGLVIAVSLVLNAGVGFAQDGLRSPVLPESVLPGPPPAAVQDIYRVPPDFYTRPRPPMPAPGPGIGGPGLGVPWWWGGPAWTVPASRLDASRLRETSPSARDDRPRMPRRVSPAAPIPPYQPGAAGPPRTLYVIPGCYAGDRPPDSTRLSPACRDAEVRVLPPS